MITRDVLRKVGGRPIRESRHGKVVVSMLNAQLRRDDITITESMTGFDILSSLYDLHDEEKRERILNEDLGLAGERNRYRILLSLIGFVIAAFVIISAAVEVSGVVQGNPGQGIAILEGVINSTFRLLELLITNENNNGT